MNHHIVYVIQIGSDPKRVYVGMTGLLAEERLKQHRRGYKSHLPKQFNSSAYPLSLRQDLAPRGRYDYVTAVRLERETRLELKRRGFTAYGA